MSRPVKESRLVGTARRPVQILTDPLQLKECPDHSPGKPTAAAWKACYHGIMHGYGFGMAIPDLNVRDFNEIAEHIRYAASEGDLRSYLNSQQCPLSLKEHYRGSLSDSRFVRIGTRMKRSAVLDSITLAQQYIMSMVLQRGLVEEKHGSGCDEGPRFDGFRVLTSVHCAIAIRVPPAVGMQDYVRLIEGDFESVSVEKTRSLLWSSSAAVPEHSENALDGWIVNHRVAEQRREYGTYAVFTLFPALGEISDDVINSAGVYVTVTDQIVRGFTTGRGEEGRYFEYVAPTDPLDRKCSRTFYMKMGTTIVLPSTCVVRIGAHSAHTIQVFGYLMRAEGLHREDIQFFSSTGRSSTDSLFEYGEVTEFHDENGGEAMVTLDMEKLSVDDQEERKYIAGTIPTIMNVELRNEFRKRLVKDLYDVGDGSGAVDMKELYKRNPVLVLDTNTEEQVREVNGEEVLMAQTGEERWIVDDVPYAYIERVKGVPLCLPLNLVSLRGEIKEYERGSDGEEESDREQEQAVETASDGIGKEESARHSKESETRGTCVGSQSANRKDTDTEVSKIQSVTEVNGKRKPGQTSTAKSSSRKRKKVVVDDDDE